MSPVPHDSHVKLCFANPIEPYMRADAPVAGYWSIGCEILTWFPGVPHASGVAAGAILWSALVTSQSLFALELPITLRSGKYRVTNYYWQLRITWHEDLQMQRRNLDPQRTRLGVSISKAFCSKDKCKVMATCVILSSGHGSLAAPVRRIQGHL